MEHLKQETVSGTQLNMDALYHICPQCFTESKVPKTGEVRRSVDFDRLRLLLGDNIAEGDERYDFTWVGKRAALQEAAKPIRKTLRPCPKESVDWENTKNLYIEGDNLEVLKLLQNSYMGKVKMIYIDPPYNTGNDFVYQDDFHQTKQGYDLFAGDVNEEGERLVRNTESNGRFHSDWCSMIYSRLMVARNLLTEDGVIFISIDDREAENLIKLCNEIFGEQCFVANISWQKNYSPRNDSKGVPTEKESIIVYGRNPGWTPKKLPRTAEMNKMYGNPDKDPKGDWRNDNAFASDAKTHQGMVYAIQHPFTGELIYPYINGHWRYSQQEMLSHMNGWCQYELQELDDAKKRAEICGVDKSEVRQGVKAIVLKKSIEDSRIQAESILKRGQWPKFYFTKNGEGGIGRKTYLSEVEGKMVTNLWLHSEVGHTDEAKKELKTLFDGDIPFDTPKPVRLIDRIARIATDKDSIVLDFFSGSATTAHAVMQYNSENGSNRKFILIQIPEKVDNKYGNLCEIGKERIRRAGKKILEEQKEKLGDLFSVEQKKLDVGFRVFKCADSNMKDVYYAPAEYDQQMLLDLEDNIKEDRNDLDLLFGCMLDWGVTLDLPLHTEKINGVDIHIVNEGDLVACFDHHIPESVIDYIASLLPMRVVLRDGCFDEVKEKMNFFEIFKQRTGWSEEEVSKNVKVI
jgi:adenine-specific DNA-methyltransferase